MPEQRSITYEGHHFTLRSEREVLGLFDERDNLILGWPVPASALDDPLHAKTDEEMRAILRHLVGARHKR